jgi:hypothetical protein
MLFINLFPFRPIPAMKLLRVIVCFHVYQLMYNIVVPLPFQHMFGKYLKILKF